MFLTPHSTTGSENPKAKLRLQRPETVGRKVGGFLLSYK